ncbi:MAG TPA: GFA family protein [Ideonella sp.]|uniref:GFA family protein n=1 Tax=Ideonella sp. TaxID=1929293 RepID=UPI002E30F5C5|nr:GFA family protein [Ideonella sp.]HEX5686858.1 GFA family protein [Ideonella sp.]
MIRGSCLCGQVRYQLDGAPQFINHCHCSMCRKVHGAAFGSFLHADGAGFRWTAGEELVKTYESSPGNLRAFCTGCGSNMPVLEDEGSHVIIPAGGLDDDPGVRPVVHIHVASKASWSTIGDGLPQFDAFPPDEFGAPYTKED